MYAILASLLLAVPSAPGRATAPAATPSPVDAARHVVATLDLAAREYRQAFDGATFAHPSEAEEAALFVAAARGAVQDLPDSLGGDMGRRIDAMAALIARSGPADSLAAAAADVERRLTLVFGVALDERPAREPSLAAGDRLFERQCAGCHGLAGHGDGPAGRGLTPPPANLTDTAFVASATPLDIYRTVTNGVPGTAMPSFEHALSREDRWDVVAHVLALSDSAARQGRSGQVAVVFGTVRGSLGGARALAARGDHAAAALKVLDGYMAFEAVEGTLEATDPALVKRAEEQFQAMRTAAAGPDTAALARAHSALAGTLEASERALTRGYTAGGLFAESFFLIVREGFEAILVVGAIMAVLAKGGGTEGRKHVRWGVIAAVLASLATAAAFEGVLLVTPAQREALEGGVMLVASATLFYVSYWLISKVEVAAWQRFVKGRIQKAVASGSALALAGAAFLAVYREGFETVLFYQALFIAGGSAGPAPVFLGLLAGSVVLVVVYVAIEKFGLRIPIRPFFAVTSAMLLFMAFTFAGTGIKELQEGAYIPATPVLGGPRVDALGIYPTLQTLVVQGVIALAIVAALIWTFVIRPQRLRAAGADAGDEARAGRKTQARSTRNTAGV